MAWDPMPSRVLLNGRVTEANWDRLDEIARLRMKQMGLTQAAVQAKGGPSPAWMRSLTNQEGPPSVRHVPHLAKLDQALLWPDGTSRRLVEGVEGWGAEEWAAERDRLVALADRISNAAWLLEQRLRAMPDEQATEMIRELFRVAGMPVRDPGAKGKESTGYRE